MSHSKPAGRDLMEEPIVARTLRIILEAIIVSAVSVASVTFYLRWPMVPYLALTVAGVSVVAFLLSRAGRIRSGVLLALAGIGYTVMHAAAVNDGVQSVGLAAVPVLIVVASLFLDRALWLLFSASALVATAGMLAIRYYVLHFNAPNTGDFGDFLILAAICVVAAIVGRLLSVQIYEGVRSVRASERRYRRIFENIQDVYFETRDDGTLLELSPAAAGLFGAPCDALIGRALASFFQSPSAFDVLLGDLRVRGRVANRELVLRNTAGRTAAVLVNAAVQTAAEGEQSIVGSILEISDRRRAEEALRESEARLRLALEATGAGSFDYYPQTGQLIWSDMTRRHFGASPEADVDRDLFLRILQTGGRDFAGDAGASDAGADGGRHLSIEYRVPGVEEGRERWVAIHGRMQSGADNRPVRLIGATFDITERKRLEEELRRRVEELQAVMEVAPVALITAHDPECRQVTVNRMGQEMFELPPGSASALAPASSEPPCAFFRDGVHVALAELPLQTAARGIEVRNSELEARFPGGRRKWLWGHASPLRDSAGRVRGAIAAVQDITEARQRTQNLLRESEERFRIAADAAPIMIWLGDADKRLTFVNQQILLFTGLPAERLLGDHWAQIIHPDDLEPARATYYAGVDQRAGYQLEYRARRADGEYRHLLGTTSPRYAGSEYVGQVGSIVDITDLKRRQEEALASQKLESVGLLASGVAHDFNNILGGVLANAELASAHFLDGVSPEPELRSIRASASRGSEIVRQLMVYAGEERESPTPVDVSAIIQDMLELLRVSVSKHAALETGLSGVAIVRAEAAQIRRIVLNLVVNASEAIAERDGVIRVTTGCATVGKGQRAADGGPVAAGEYVQIEVSDSGPGVPNHVRSRIFDPFFTTKSVGRGLGLAVVQGIVRTLRGAIRLASATETGTVFQILLPRLETPPPAAVGPAPDGGAAAGNSNASSVLIVEDEDLLREPVAEMLRKSGFTVVKASDGSRALEIIRTPDTPLDLVFLDVSLPGRPSHEVLREARRLRPGLRVVATSAYGEDFAARALQGPFDGFIRKPYGFRHLLDTVRRVLSGG